MYGVDILNCCQAIDILLVKHSSRQNSYKTPVLLFLTSDGTSFYFYRYTASESCVAGRNDLSTVSHWNRFCLVTMFARKIKKIEVLKSVHGFT